MQERELRSRRFSCYDGQNYSEVYRLASQFEIYALVRSQGVNVGISFEK